MNWMMFSMNIMKFMVYIFMWLMQFLAYLH